MTMLSFTILFKYLTRRVYCTLTILVLFIIYFGINVNNIKSVYEYQINISDSKVTPVSEETNKSDKPEEIQDVRYILLWGDPEQSPFNYFGEGHSVFEEKNCSWTNCFVTSDRNYLGDYTEFEAVLFNGPDIHELRSMHNLPQRRSPHQKYVYVNIESAANYPICTDYWDEYFNWTWTYRLDSDIVWRYYVIRNSTDHDIGPSPNIRWLSEQAMEPVDQKVRAKLRYKTKAAAWYASNCNTMSMREDLALQIQKYMRIFQLDLDTFGECGKLHCPRSSMAYCLNKLEEDYYFYFAFENSLSEDYVTEKVLHALQHNTVPVVFGGADYRRFLPPGSYLDAGELGPRKLAERIKDLMRRPDAYLEFFRWKNHYRVEATHARPDSDVYCRFCAALNEPRFRTARASTYPNFRRWWMPLTSCKDVVVIKIH